ncbi:hypothetical protein BDV3_001544 [Batrachochytrium dendrobatidis]|uniref:Threonine/serine exporter-like N-terminal domain-containing protein n=1 Tax=Batrachochytrium dendrobatidis (strain JEL423) TaxID=403673 RepID=A0A177WBJ9_BATDL|nr:pheromone-regulated protein prm10 [Batrachochytrium dendrobatidis]KAK5668288.1 pheromone-regulated protein prm10 [Batrachochytrium dendrobatidis]OAJ36980.1 hypothetical protein BDEG_21071 [Batrachochytrium dendrobatidis JEL423]
MEGPASSNPTSSTDDSHSSLDYVQPIAPSHPSPSTAAPIMLFAPYHPSQKIAHATTIDHNISPSKASFTNAIAHSKDQLQHDGRSVPNRIFHNGSPRASLLTEEVIDNAVPHTPHSTFLFKVSPNSSPRLETHQAARPASSMTSVRNAPVSLPNQVHRKGLRPYMSAQRWPIPTESSPLSTGISTDRLGDSPTLKPAYMADAKGKLPPDIMMIVQDANPIASSQSLPLSSSRQPTSNAGSLLKLFSPPSCPSDSDGESVSSSSSSATGTRRKRSRFRKGISLTSPSNESIAFQRPASTSSLSLANIAASIQNYQHKRQAKEHATYMEVYGDREEYTLKCNFMLELARCMVEYGVPIHRFEYHLEAVGMCLGIQSSFVALAGLILISFNHKNRASDTFFIKCSQGYQMGKLSLTNALCFELVHGGMDIQQAQSRLKEIRSAPDTPGWKSMVTYPVIAFCLGVIGFNCSWIESMLAVITSIPVACLTYMGGKYPSITYLSEFLSTFFCVLLGNSLVYVTQRVDPCLSTQRIVFSSIAIILPGLQLTTAIIELSTRNLISGTVRLFFALFLALLLGFGYIIGINLTSSLDIAPPAADCPTSPINILWAIPTFPPLALSICYEFQARRSQYAIMIVTSAIGYVTTFLIRIPIFKNNFEVVTILSALAIGLTANIYARITRDVAVAPILASILLLVPGSVGLRSTLGFMSQDTLSGTAIAFQMLMIGMCITIGLFIATLIVWPIRGPRMKYITV